MDLLYYPRNTEVVIRLDKLIKITEKRALSDIMSTRMVKCASVLDKDEFVGWQMMVPVKGIVRMSVFGTETLTKSDLEWITESTGKVGKNRRSSSINSDFNELYEIYLPIAEKGLNNTTIGFSGNVAGGDDETFSKWPTYFSSQFEELVRVLQISGAVLRVVVGSADEEERMLCKKSVLRTYSSGNLSPDDYIGRPVKSRVLLRLPSVPSIRLKTVIDESVPGAKLRYLGSMDKASVKKKWDNPLSGAVVLPDYAARIMLLEPEALEVVVGIEVCEEEMKKIPASHKNSKDKDAVTIGKATDTSGVRRIITIAERDIKRHYQIVGQTGTGKSTLLSNLILSAIEHDHGLTFFDPHGSTIDTVLKSLPEKYSDRVRVVRIGDADNPVPMNIWDSDDPAKEERNINDLCDLFGDIFDPKNEGMLGPRWERWFATFAKASIAFLGRRASLESIQVISQSKDNMYKVSKAIGCAYPELVETIKQEYGTDRSSDFQNILNWYLCKFQRLTAVEQLRETLGAGANALDFNHTIDSDTVTLIDLATPVIGTHAGRIIGTILLMKLWNAAMARKERGKMHLVVVDEASLFQTNPMPRMLAESRKFGIAMVLCHQHTGQLTAEIRDALEANSANFSAFRLSPRDASSAAIRFDDPSMQVSLTRLDAFNAITTLSVDGKQTAPFTLEIDFPKKPKNSSIIAEKIENKSRDLLVKPYIEQRALTSTEILDFLNHPEKLADQNPVWFPEWSRLNMPAQVQPIDDVLIDTGDLDDPA